MCWVIVVRPLTAQVGDEVGWVPSQSLQEIDAKAPGRQQHVPPQDVTRRTWGSKKKVILYKGIRPFCCLSLCRSAAAAPPLPLLRLLQLTMASLWLRVLRTSLHCVRAVWY